LRIAVVLATFGDRKVWDRYAHRAQLSVHAQTRPPDEFHPIHAESLHVARNRGAMASSAEWLCFLDADDLLSPGYLQAMELSVASNPAAHIHVPHVEKYRNDKVFKSGRLKEPGVSIFERNHLPIGAMVRRDLFLQVGGFDDWPIYEDWALWMKLEAAGARWAWCPDAIYKINWRNCSRNKDISLRGPTLRRIRESILKSSVIPA